MNEEAPTSNKCTCETCKKELSADQVERDIFGRIECADCWDAQMMRDKMDANSH